MIDIDFAKYCYQRILDIYFDSKQNERKKLLLAFSVLKEFVLKLDEEDSQLFTGFFQRIHFVIQKYGIKRNIAKKLHTIRFFVSRLKDDTSIALSQYELDLRLCDIFMIIGGISQAPFPLDVPFLREEILEENRNLFYEKVKHKDSNVPHLRVYSLGCDTSADSENQIILAAKSEQYDDITIAINHPWAVHPNMYAEGTVISFVNIGFDGKSYYTNQNTLLAIEPDYLIDVTDIAKCFDPSKPNPHIYFLSKFFTNKTGEAATIGNIINTIFDELILDIEVDFDTAYEVALKAKPLQILALLKYNANFQAIRGAAVSHFHKIKSILPKLSAGRKSIEPSFIATKYGLQGRLDLLIEDESLKYVIELKSGKPPSSSIRYRDIDEKDFMLGAWKSHAVQAVCYIMLMESTFGKSPIVSSIYYSADSTNPLRNVPNVLGMKKEILKCRNYIVSVEKALAKNKFLIFGYFNFNLFGDYTSFQQHWVQDFAINYKGFDELEKDYFHSLIGFITRERFSQKIGNHKNSNGSASLWLDSPEDKESSYSIMRNLRLLPNESDFDKLHISFEIRDRLTVNSFRKGDICLIYSINHNGKFSITSDKLLKGSIRDMSSNRVVVSLRNKMSDFEFDANCEWAMEQDSMDTLHRYYYASVYSLLRQKKQKRGKLLGTIPPETAEVPQILYPELSQFQYDLLYKSLSAKDYFLLQGPPGTGKTSFMLRYMVKYLYENTEENIILLAYTNRAVDEICATLNKISPNFPFLRLGSKGTTEFTDNLIAEIAEKDSLPALSIKVQNCRIFVSTAASALTSQDLFSIKTFHTAIIDEASQIPEYNLHLILTQVDRFILIGDEKQLPAVITQPRAGLLTSSQSLSEIELNDLSASYFERMLRNAKRREWRHCYGMLTQQARMSSSIMNLANYLFYKNNLQMSEIYNADANAIKSEKFDIINHYDIIFIDIPNESISKVNRGEASLAAELAKELSKSFRSEFNSSKIGIIAPFRAQVAKIFDELGSHLQEQIDVDTVERFQGSERDVIIISFAVNDVHDIEKISNECEIDGEIIDRKLNVAITRAKKKLIMLGNVKILMQSPIYEKMINYIKLQKDEAILISAAEGS